MRKQCSMGSVAVRKMRLKNRRSCLWKQAVNMKINVQRHHWVLGPVLQLPSLLCLSPFQQIWTRGGYKTILRICCFTNFSLCCCSAFKSVSYTRVQRMMITFGPTVDVVPLLLSSSWNTPWTGGRLIGICPWRWIIWNGWWCRTLLLWDARPEWTLWLGFIFNDKPHAALQLFAQGKGVWLHCMKLQLSLFFFTLNLSWLRTRCLQEFDFFSLINAKFPS